jgi:hypothetical protein
MNTMISSLFPSRRHGSGSSGKRRQRRGEQLHVQRLEERIALAIDVFQYPVAGVSSGSSNYAVLLMDDGTNGFLKKNATPAPTFTYANNSQFLDDPLTPAFEAYTFGELVGGYGPLESFYITSGKRETYEGLAIPATFLGTTTAFINVATPPGTTPPINIGTSDGIVPGTFRASASIVDKDGKSAFVRLLASKPGDPWNLSIEKVSGDGAVPTQGNIDEFSGDVVLRGWSDPPQSVDLRPSDWGVYTGQFTNTIDGTTDPKPLSFTLFPGQNVTQRFLADLSRNESTISINSPLLATMGSASDPGFFSGAGDVAGQVGQVVLDGSTVVTNANVLSSNLFTVGVPLWTSPTLITSPLTVSTRIPVDTVAINRPVASPKYQLIVEGAIGAPGQLLVSEQGALANSLTNPAAAGAEAGSLDIQALHTDVIFAGTINASRQTYLMQSPLDTRAYTLTTVSPTSGSQTGRIISDTVGIALANDAGGEVNVRTTVDTLRMTTASTLSQPALPYAINVAESDDLIVDAVPASRRPIAIDAAGTLKTSSAVLTSGDVSLTAATALTIGGTIASSAGNVTLRSQAITATVPITAGGTRGVSLQTSDAAGDLVLNGLVRAGGQVKTPVRAATTADVDLATGGLLTIDGVTLNPDDRVLVKNQTNPAENGIYVVAAGPWSRAADASISQLLVPGFTTAVREGAQQGAWTFANPETPTLGQTGLAFVPSSAVQAYVPARVATTAITGNVNLALGGLLTIDGVALVAGDRVLVKNQTNTRQNGLYIANSGTWVRAADANTAAELVAGSYVFVAEGSAGQQGYVLADDAVQVGNTPLNFVPFAVQATRTNTYSPARVLTSVVAATTVHVNLAAPPAEIDGVELNAGDLILVKNQFDAATNGVYVYAAGGLQRWIGADSSSEVPRGAMVYVDQGATNAGSSWTFNDSIDVLGETTTGSLQVTGLPSTLYLASGMLVSGSGIPADTRVDLIVNGTTVRLTKSALATSSTAVLSFMQTSSVAVGTTPIVFVPTGGTAAVTAGRSITSSTTSPTSRITASSAVLTAGRPLSGTADTASLIDVKSAVGRLTAMAPGSVGVSDSGAIDLFDVRTLVGGEVAVDAQGTISARSVLAAGSATAPANVTLESAYGDVVAATVTSSLGSIDLTSANERVVVRRLGLNGASVTAVDGDVVATANVGGILLEGPVTAGGTDGDITLRSDQKGLTLVPPATLSATDRLTVTTPNAVPSVATGVTVSAAALSLTSQFGASQSLPTGFGTFSTINLNRTDAGSLVLASLVGLTVEAATAVAGDISLTAPSMQVTGGVTAGSSVAGDGAIKLIATAGNIDLAAPVTALADRVTLDAAAGVITSTGQINSQTLVWYATTSPFPGLAGTFNRVGSNLTGPGSLSLGTAGTPIVIVGASTINGSITIVGSNVRIVDVVKANGGDPVSITATTGNIEFVANTLGGIVSVPGAVTTGSVTLTASSGQVMAANKATRTTVRGGPLSVVAQTADLKCNVTSLTSTTTVGGLTASAVGVLTIAGVAAAGQSVALNAASGVTQASGGITANALTVTNGSGTVNLTSTSNAVSTVAISNGSGDVSLTNSGSFTVAAPGIATGTGSAGDGDISLQSIGGSIGLNAGVTAGGDLVTLNATSGSITQAAGATITSDTLVWYASAVPSLTGSYVGIGSNLTAPGSLSLAVTPAQRVLTTSTVNGGITITGSSVVISEPVTAGGTGSGVTVQATTGNVTLQPSSSLVPSINASNGAVNVLAGGQFDTQFGTVFGSSVSIVSGGTVFVGTIRATNTMSVVTTAGGGVSVGPQAGALLQAGSTLDLSQVQGQIRIRNGGQIIGNPLVLGGKTVSFGGAITTVAELNDVVNAVNSLPVVAGSTYEILVGASMTLTQTLTINRPVTFRGTSTSIVLSGSASVTNGLAFTSGAAGSTVRDIAFSNFSGTAVRATSLSGLTISGIKVMNSGTGINLSSVTNSLIGGTASGQGNVLQNCSREGIYATGICTNTQLVKNTFPGTTTKYNVSSSRGITVVN